MGRWELTMYDPTLHGWFLGEVYKISIATETKGRVF
jgi:hypothetical protein